MNVPLTIKGHKLSISLREDTDIDNRILVSLRSVDDFPCNKMAAEFFNGGGHRNASGRQIALQHTGGETDSTEGYPGIRRYAEVADFFLRNDEKGRKQPRFEAIG